MSWEGSWFSCRASVSPELAAGVALAGAGAGAGAAAAFDDLLPNVSDAEASLGFLTSSSTRQKQLLFQELMSRAFQLQDLTSKAF